MTRKIRKPLQQISIIVTLSFVSSNTLKFLFEQNPTYWRLAYFNTSWADKNVFNRPATNQIKLQLKLNCQKQKFDSLFKSVFSV